MPSDQPDSTDERAVKRERRDCDQFDRLRDPTVPSGTREEAPACSQNCHLSAPVAVPAPPDRERDRDGPRDDEQPERNQPSLPPTPRAERRAHETISSSPQMPSSRSPHSGRAGSDDRGLLVVRVNVERRGSPRSPAFRRIDDYACRRRVKPDPLRRSKIDPLRVAAEASDGVWTLALFKGESLMHDGLARRACRGEGDAAIRRSRLPRET
jgi:hypothetical protein